MSVAPYWSEKLLSLEFKPVSKHEFQVLGVADILIKDERWIRQNWTETWGVEIDDAGKVQFVSLLGTELETPPQQLNT